MDRQAATTGARDIRQRKKNTEQLDSPLLKRLVYINLALMDSYLPGIESVIYKDISAVDAIAEIEVG